MSLKQISELLAVNLKTMNRQAIRLGLLFPRSGAIQNDKTSVVTSAGRKKQVIDDVTQAAYRQQWLKAQQDYHELSRSRLKSKFTKIHRWLYKHDGEWLKEHLPPIQKELPKYQVKSEITPVLLELNRQQLLSIITNKPSIGRNQIKNQYRKLHEWLSTFDREWLEAHLPIIQTRSRPYSPIVDWEQRDIQISKRLESVVKEIQSIESPKLVRLSKTRIINKIGTPTRILKNVDKLPRTSQALASATETHEEFAVRRVLWAARLFKDEEVVPQQWQIIRRAGLTITMRKVLKVKAAIFEALKQQNDKDPGTC